ncbi:MULTISPECIES: Rv3654c family TadE-like protein [unclassified Microbacterium]|uniref:Rv3654c family TadE-like protein n=1 Tax=unclassified Microbacterium TaxID=2609290 RepID=UPI002740C921|nr:Rv3654c family TadE-like protein [Microbacterium sp. RU1D]
MTTVGVVAVVAAMTVALDAVGGAAVTARRVAGTADAAALAAADTVSGAVPGYPCDAAARVTVAAGWELTECRLDGLIATVTVAGAYGGVPLDARSRAGPPDVSSP